MQRSTWNDGGSFFTVGLVTAALILAAACFAPPLSGRVRHPARNAPRPSWQRTMRLDQALAPKLYAALVAVHPEVARMRAVTLSGQHYGNDARDLVLADPGAVVVLRKTFSIDGQLHAAGPVVALGQNWVTSVSSERWVWALRPHRIGRVVAREASGLEGVETAPE